VFQQFLGRVGIAARQQELSRSPVFDKVIDHWSVLLHALGANGSLFSLAQ
jgi:hypothetical protein